MKITEVSDLLREKDIIVGMPAKGERSALARIAAEFEERTGKDKREILAALVHRERLGSTGVGGGVAVPHALLHDIAAPVSLLATLQTPIWFDAPDSAPVDLLLGLIWPKSDTIGLLRGLAVVCRILRQPELRSRLRTSETPAEANAWIKHFGVDLARQFLRSPFIAVEPPSLYATTNETPHCH
jgi:PTS system nitrogen regulatory IIA component